MWKWIAAVAMRRMEAAEQDKTRLSQRRMSFSEAAEDTCDPQEWRK